MAEHDTATQSGCPHAPVAKSGATDYASIEALRAYTQTCTFERADIASLAKRLLAGEICAPPASSDPAALKVEKNALAVVFIPAVFALIEEFLVSQPGALFTGVRGHLDVVDRHSADAFLVGVRRHPGHVCLVVNDSLVSAFEHFATLYILALKKAATEGDPQSAWAVEALLTRYEVSLSAYHTHTSVANAAHFTPTNHIMAGIRTALFFILRALSAMVVLGERTLGRPVTPEDLAAAVHEASPLLLTIARCHLEQLLELEVLLGKQTDLYLTRLDLEAYAQALGGMFTMGLVGETLRLDFTPEVLAALPVLSSPKPRTGCPALFAATANNENAIVALVRITESAFRRAHYP